MGSKASLSYPPWITLFVPQKQILFWPYNQSFTDQACLVEMSKYYPCIFIDLSLISVHKNAKGTWPTTSYLDHTLGQQCINNIQFCLQSQRFGCLIILESKRQLYSSHKINFTAYVQTFFLTFYFSSNLTILPLIIIQKWDTIKTTTNYVNKEQKCTHHNVVVFAHLNPIFFKKCISQKLSENEVQHIRFADNFRLCYRSLFCSAIIQVHQQ